MRKYIVLLALPVLLAGCTMQDSATMTSHSESDTRMASDVETPYAERSAMTADDWGGWKHATADDYRSLE